MKVALANLGSLGFALKTSLEYLGAEVFLSSSQATAQEIGEHCLRSEICHPLKLILGNYLLLKDKKPEIVCFYEGCDLCNLPPANKLFLEMFEHFEWRPKSYSFDVSDRFKFLRDYYKNLRKITGASRIEVIKAIFLGYKKFKLFEYLDKVFYVIRPAINNYNTGEQLYTKLFNRLKDSKSFKEYRDIKKDISTLLIKYPIKPDSIYVGLIGDPYSLEEPFSHLYSDKMLGYAGIIVDRWLKNELIFNKPARKFNLKKYFKSIYGVLTPKEIKKLNLYVQRNYDGLVFIAPFSCNPNDALRNQLTVMCREENLPLLSLIFDGHTSATGIQSRIEAFSDMLRRKKC